MIVVWLDQRRERDILSWDELALCVDDNGIVHGGRIWSLSRSPIRWWAAEAAGQTSEHGRYELARAAVRYRLKRQMKAGLAARQEDHKT